MAKRGNRLEDVQEYFFSQKFREIRELERSGQRVVNLGIGSPDLPPDEAVRAQIGITAQNPDTHGYQPYNGIEPLRKAITGFMQQHFSVEFSAGEILPLMGSKEGLLHIMLAFTDPGDTLLVPELGYPAYASIGKMLGLRVETYPLDDDWQPDWESFPSKAAAARMLWLNYPHMPTGAPPARKTFERAVQWGRDHEVMICHDNPYALVLNREPMSVFQVEGSRNIALELHSLSKSHHMAGWRVGWVAGKSEYISEVLKAKSNIDSGMFRGIQEAAIKALELNWEWHEERNRIYRERQALAFEVLDLLNCSYQEEQSGMFVWGRLPDGASAMETCDSLLKNQRVFITPGEIFGERGKDCLRVSLCADKAQMDEAISRIKM